MESEIKIKIESLLIGFGSGNRIKPLLPPLSATGGKGELISVIGRNGIGKSTLLRSLAGIRNILGGQVYYNELEIGSYNGSELARIIGFISTEQVRVSNMTVYDLVSLGRYPYTNWLGTLTSDDTRCITEAMEQTSVLQFSGRYVAELSDGERQRSMIARLIAQDSEILLMDEPTAFLDIRSKFEIVHLLHHLAHSKGKTIIFTTHDFDLAIRHSDKIWLVLDDGIRQGAPEDLMLARMFEHLFDSEIVRFNSGEGSYSFTDISRGNVHVEGTGPVRYWTEKAVTRAGFSVIEQENADYKILIADQKWTLCFGRQKTEYTSIYDLTREMSGLI